MKSSRILKWNVEVRIFLLECHFAPNAHKYIQNFHFFFLIHRGITCACEEASAQPGVQIIVVDAFFDVLVAA